jgi:hypothetical protein
MKIIILKEKHGNIYIKWSKDKNIQEVIANKILSRRINQSLYSSYEEIAEITKAKATNKCLKYMYSRKEWEYEDFEIETIDKLH